MKKFLPRLKSSLSGIRWINFPLLLIAGIINSIGVVLFLAPVNLYDSGISGTSMLLWQLTPEALTLPLFLVILNVPLFLFGLKKQGLVFTLYSLWAVLCYSLSSFLLINVIRVDVSAGSPFAGQDILLCALFGGLISGIGSGLTLRFGGAIDGIEVLASIFAKKIGITVGSFVMIYNVILYVAVGAIFQSWTLPLYSIVTYCVGIKAVDFIVEGLDKGKSAIIVTEKREAVCAALSEEFGHGLTILDAKGYYSNRQKCMILIVVNRFQIARLKSAVAATDPNAFITITEVSDVLGSDLKKAAAPALTEKGQS